MKAEEKYSSTILVSAEINKRLCCFTGDIAIKAISWFLKEFENGSIKEVCSPLKRKNFFITKRVYLIESEYQKIKDLARENKISLTSLLDYIFKRYFDYLES